MTNVWNPRVESATEKGNIHTSFTPWDERSEYIRVSLVREREKYIQDEIYLPRMQTSAIFTDVPCGVEYRVHLRSYDAHNMSLMRFYWINNNTIEVPCVSNVTTVQPQPSTDMDLLAIVGVSMVTTLLLLTVALCLWYRRAGIMSICERYCLHGRAKQENHLLNNFDNYIFPIYYIENSAHGEAIHALIRLLQGRGMNIHTYDEQRHNIRADIKKWVETSLERCTCVLVYHSETLDRLLIEDILPENHYIYGGVCQYSLRQLYSGPTKTTVHVTLDVFEETATTDLTSLVIKDELGIRLVNVDLVLKKLSRSPHDLLAEAEISELKESLCRLHGVSSVTDKDDHDSEFNLSETDSLLDGGEKTFDDISFQGRAVS